MRRYCLIILLITLFPAGSIWARTSPAARLEQNLSQYRCFRWQGILEINQSAFALRKNFVLAKDSSAYRLDILESGIMGLQAKPLLTLYISKHIYLSAPGISQLQGIDPNWFIPPQSLRILFTYLDSLQAGSKEILSKKEYLISSFQFSFDKKYRIAQVIERKSGLEVRIKYNRKNKPDKLTFVLNGTNAVILTIDEIQHEDIMIEKPSPLSLPPQPDSVEPWEAAEPD